MAIHSYVPILKNISISFTTYSKQSSENVNFPRKVEFNKKIYYNVSLISFQKMSKFSLQALQKRQMKDGIRRCR
jgi:hypothetical protein